MHNRWILQCSGHPETKTYPPTPSHLFPVSPGREVAHSVATQHNSNTHLKLVSTTTVTHTVLLFMQ